MFSRIKDQPAVGKLIAQYDQLPRRDQQALVVLAIAVFLGLLYFAVWRPAAGLPKITYAWISTETRTN